MARLHAANAGKSIRDTFFRATHPKYADAPNLLSGTGTMLHGSRWCTAGVGPVVHAVDTPENAVSESLAARRHFGLPDRDELPLVIRSINCRLRDVLDLTDGTIRTSIRVSENRMREADWRSDNHAGLEALTQAIGRAAIHAGFEGLLAPSAPIDQATTGVFFVNNLAPGSSIAINDRG